LGDLAITGAETGAVVEVSLDAGQTWLTWVSTDRPNFTAREGANTILVRQIDLAGNVSATSTLQFTLDTQVATLTVGLANDSGVAGDGLTNDAELLISNLEAGSQVQYSLDGVAWASSFVAADARNTVYVRQIDLAGNVSAASPPLSFTLDTSAAKDLAVRLASDTGIEDGITNNGKVNVGGLEPGAKWFYSTDGGSHWTQGSDNAFELRTEGAISVLVRQQDAADNYSETVRLSFNFDKSAPTTPMVRLATDSAAARSAGASASNGIAARWA
jgi:hypothetical protein